MHFKVYFDDETAQRLTAAPKAMAEKFAAITALTDALCAQPLDLVSDEQHLCVAQENVAAIIKVEINSICLKE